MLKIGAILGNRYEILEKIGAGGMSVVYKARDTKLERPVTVKILRDEFATDEDFVARFRVEAQAAASLSHPNIVNVYDVGIEDDIYYIVMEFINGCTLKDIIIKEAPFDNKKTLDYALKIAAALQHAHKNHIVHRDIKPQNILVTTDGELKVTDFGIAHAATSSTVTMTSTAIGSVHYFSPEQARGGYVDEKSDLYSLGIVMYEMVTGKLPFEGDSSVSIALKHINEDLPPISKINPNISKSLEGIILKTTQKRVDQRYTDIDSMITDMKKALNDPTGTFIETKDLAFSTTQKLSIEDLKTIREAKKPVEEESDDYEDDDEIIPDDEYEDDDDYEEDELNKSEEIKLILAAVFTAIAIIALILTIGFFVFKKPNSPNTNIAQQQSVKTPDLIGKTAAEATTILTEQGVYIKLSTEKIESDTIEENLIADQSPVAGTQIQKGSEVLVTLSKGSQMFEIPDVVGKTQIEALKTIKDGEEDQKFTLDEPKKVYSDDVDPGLIVSQDPKAGEMAKFATAIKINISRGPEPKTTNVPNIVGLTEKNARTKLDNANLAPEVTYQESNTVNKNIVISQAVRAGEEVHEGDLIPFVVSIGKAQATTEETTETTTKSSTEKTEVTTKETETTTGDLQTESSQTEISTSESTTNANLKTKTITIPAPSVDVGVEKVVVKVFKVTDEYYAVYNEERNIEDFPFTVDVSGSGTAEIQVTIDGKLQSTSKINFDE